MDSFLSAQRSTIFSHVGVLIYVFDTEVNTTSINVPASNVMEYYKDCLEGIREYSPHAKVFLLVHKMDLVREPRNVHFEKRRNELVAASGEFPVTVFGTSIFDESLYRVSFLELLV